MTELWSLPDDPLRSELDAFVDLHGLPERGRSLDRTPEFPWREFRAMGTDGWLGLTRPANGGGRGLSLDRAAVLLFHLARRAGTAFAKLALQPEFASVLGERGSASLREEWYAPLLRGERLVGNQLTEPHAGSDAGAIALRAERDGGDYRLTGEKSEVAFAADAGAAIVYGRTGSAGTSGGITAFLVPQDLPGIDRAVGPPDLGERWQRRGEVRYRNVRVPANHRLGEEGAGLGYVLPELARERGLLAAIYLGVARASWEETVRHVGERSVFRRPLSEQQAVAFPLLDDGARLEATWLFVRRSLERLANDPSADAETALAKSMATDVALTTIDHAIQFHGGRGYSGALPHEQRWRDVRSGPIAHGPSELLHRVAARRLWPKSPAGNP